MSEIDGIWTLSLSLQSHKWSLPPRGQNPGTSAIEFNRVSFTFVHTYIATENTFQI